MKLSKAKVKRQIKTKMKNNRGITLIALVITIIVLLILAGVSIAMLTGENGILTQAQRAKNETENAQANEENILSEYEKYINATENGNTMYTDKNGKTAIIPKGFYIVPGLDIIDDGLVISDIENDTQDIGNQFVWIPVEDEGQYVRNKNYENIDISETAYTDTGYLPDGIQPNIPEEITDEQEIGSLNEQAERKVVLQSGGFYVSRYEAGNDGVNNLISQKNVSVYNRISQADCKEKAKTFINNQNVKSALCSGIQWDMIMNFVNGKITGKSEIFDVTNYNSNRHTGEVANSGQNEYDNVCNIYDLEGNFYEYIAEKTTYDIDVTGQFVNRGGASIGTYRSASQRVCGSGPISANHSFRFVLYVM